MLPKLALDRLYYYVIVVTAFSLPFHRNIGSVLAIVLCLLWLLSGGFKEKWNLLTLYKLPLLFASLFFVYIVGLTYTSNFSYAFSRVERSIPLLVFPVVIFSSKAFNRAELNTVLKAFISGVLLASVIAIAHGLYRRFIAADMTQVELNNFYIDLPHIFMHHIQYGIFLAIGLFFLAYLAGQEKKKSFGKKAEYLLLGLFFLNLLLLAGGFMAFIAVTVISILALLFLPQKRVKVILTVSLAALAMLFILLIQSEKNPLVQRYTQRLSLSFSEIENNKYNYSSTRVGPLVTALSVLEENWLFGVGTGDTADAMKEEYINSGLDQLTEFNTHNQYLDFWISFGIFGIIILLANLVYPIYVSLKHKSYIYLCFLVLVSFCFLTENLLATNKTIYLYAFLNSILALHAVNQINPKLQQDARPL
ncbi:O-antigen ligase [Pontibacter ummariensis]|uniref:O-antigen ligase n=1 Tax=Pontibacter ummariensis TaxID=1610492 RepID=A0A239FDN1_9BACT|nr:O-antigen ligase family protein [Pontibacter ummariensis]PRY12308.1 O-antigen ligase [Pontibacter ummariensis]SNS54861.1 O-antigen ligase [Pontibacter ummariensis]